MSEGAHPVELDRELDVAIRKCIGTDYESGIVATVYQMPNFLGLKPKIWYVHHPGKLQLSI